MRIFLKKLITSSNISFTRVNAIRRWSGDTKNDPLNKEEVKKTEEVLHRNVILEKYNGITTLNLNRVDTRNSLDESTLREIEAAVDDFEKDDAAKVLVFHGEGGSFCSGFDIDEIGEKGYNTLMDASARLRQRPFCNKITIAAMSGYAVAEGFELAIACDLRIMEETTVMGLLGRRFGVPCGLLGARRLTTRIGLSRALDLLITGRLITGPEAYQMGLAHKLTSTGTALGESIKLAKSLVKFPQSAMIMDKMAAVNSTLDPSSIDSMRDETIMTSLRGQAIEDMKEGVAKFHGGIGKHGKFYQLTEVPLKDWELEDSVEEVTVKLNQVQKKNDDGSPADPCAKFK